MSLDIVGFCGGVRGRNQGVVSQDRHAVTGSSRYWSTADSNLKMGDMPAWSWQTMLTLRASLLLCGIMDKEDLSLGQADRRLTPRDLL